MNLTDYTTSQILAAFNRLSGENVKRFTDRSTAEKRITALLEKLGLDADAIASPDAKAKRDEFSIPHLGFERLKKNADAEALRQDTLAAQEAAMKSVRIAKIEKPAAAPKAAKPKAAPKAGPVSITIENKIDFRDKEAVDGLMLYMLKQQPAKVGAYRAAWIAADKSGFGKLAPTQQKGIMRASINRLAERGKIKKDGQTFSAR